MSKSRSYKIIREELDEIMHAFETSQHEDVDEMLKDYDKATKLVSELEAYLNNAELKLKTHKATK